MRPVGISLPRDSGLITATLRQMPTRDPFPISVHQTYRSPVKLQLRVWDAEQAWDLTQKDIFVYALGILKTEILCYITRI